MDLSRKRLARKFKAPAIALGAVSYLKKLTNEKTRKSERVSVSFNDGSNDRDSETTAIAFSKTTEAESVDEPKQSFSAPIISKSALPAKKHAGPFGRCVWAALKEKGQGNAAAGVAAALDGFTDDDGGECVPAVKAASQLSDAIAARSSITSPVPVTRGTAAEVAAQTAARLLVHASPTAATQAAARLSGHASPMQSLSSTGSGRYGSRVPSPDARRCQSPAGSSPERMYVGGSPTQMAMRAVGSMSPHQDSEIADLEQQTARMPSFESYPGSSAPTGAQVGPLSACFPSPCVAH